MISIEDVHKLKKIEKWKAYVIKCPVIRARRLEDAELVKTTSHPLGQVGKCGDFVCILPTDEIRLVREKLFFELYTVGQKDDHQS